MRTRKVFLGIFLTALVMTVVLISIKAYYVAIALVIGILLVGYRELWSLLRTRKLPPFDERIRENIGKSVRNGFIFLVFALAFLMLPFSTILISKPDTAQVLGGLLLSGGLAYLLSFIFYDRVEPKLCERGLKMLKIFLMTAGISVAVFILGVFLHNALSGLFGVEEPVFFFISVFLAPLGFTVGLIGSLVIFVQGLSTKA
ncbi:MAG TPA: hypothetical protein G4N93_06875 [Dehalococcoidia bacterium]|nr:hypothetical protein [Dehalococcoidia bacterium]